MKSNNQNNNQNNKGKSNNYSQETKKTVMNLEKLKSDYQKQLTSYNQAVSNYINYLQQNPDQNTPDQNINNPTFIVSNGKTFWGTGPADSQSVSVGGTIEQCKALCATHAKCSGATFNPSAHGQPMCWLRTGDGQLSPALNTDYAIVPEAKQLLLIIKDINDELLKTNQQIQQTIKEGEPLYNSIKSKSQEQNNELIQSYYKLSLEREKIKKLLNSYQNIDQAQSQSNIKITQRYYTFVLLLIIAICFVILLYKYSSIFSNNNSTSSSTYIQTGGELGTVSYVYLVFVFIVLFFSYVSDISNLTNNFKMAVRNLFTGIYNFIKNFLKINYNV